MMELKSLKSFVAVATLKNFSAAARELHTVQPAISRHILSLEEELDTALFIRNTRYVKITAAGEQLLKEATEILALVEGAKLRTLKTAKGEIGTLKIGYLPSACLTFLPQLIKKYKSHYPNVEVTLFEMTVSQQITAFEANQIDLGFSRPLPDNLTSNFDSKTIYTDRLTVILPNDHALANKNQLSLYELKDEAFILFNRDEAVSLFDGIISLCQENNFSPNIVGQPKHMQTLLTTVASGLGVGIAPYCTSALFTQGCTFVPISGSSPTILTQLHYKKLLLSPTAKAFIECSDR